MSRNCDTEIAVFLRQKMLLTGQELAYALINLTLACKMKSQTKVHVKQLRPTL